VLPLVRLGALLGAPTPPSSRRWAVVVEHESLRFAFTCDKVVGPREIVVKALGPLLAPLPLYAGATISGAGKVQLIIELSTLVSHARAGVTLGTRPGDLAERRVLVADDSRSLRTAAALMLSQGGYRVDTVPDGWDAWELLQDERFDLLITDVEMPRLDGCELTSRVRHHPDLGRMAVLVMSARTGEATRHRALAAGADGFLAKPLRRRPLLDAVSAALSARDQPSNLST
jgi:CheY-like chemotaxis protein